MNTLINWLIFHLVGSDPEMQDAGRWLAWYMLVGLGLAVVLLITGCILVWSVI